MYHGSHLIESTGLKVWVLASDGATANRKFFGMFTVKEGGNIYWTANPHDESRKIYFMSDVPHHLLKPQGIVWKTITPTRIQICM